MEILRDICAHDPRVKVIVNTRNFGHVRSPYHGLLQACGDAVCYIAADLKEYLEKELNIRHIHGRPLHPQTQGKIERYHRSMKNVVKLDNYYSPEQLKKAIDDFVHYYNYERYHESLGNLTPADFYFGRQDQVTRRRAKIKMESFKRRRTLFQKQALVNRSMN